MLLARIYESAPLACPQCGADIRIIAFVIDGVGSHVLHQLFRRAVCTLVAGLQNGEAMTTLRLIHEVGGDQDACAGVDQVEQLFPELPAGFRVDRGCWLVQKEQLWSMRRRRCECQTLALTAAHAPGALTGDPIETVYPHQLVDPLFAGPIPQAVRSVPRTGGSPER